MVWNFIDPAGIEGVTTHNSPCAENQALESAESLDSLVSIRRTRGIEPASGAGPWRDLFTVEIYQEKYNLFHRAFLQFCQRFFSKPFESQKTKLLFV
jgi:hypothetical protein